MPNKYNPFRPDKICPPGIFSGRSEELESIEHCFAQARHGNPQHFLVRGERGIGKSSILEVERYIARGDIFPPSGDKFNFIVLNVVLEERDDHITLLKKIAYELHAETNKKDPKKYVLKALEFISQIEIHGFKFNRDNVARDEIDLFSKLQNDFVNVISTFQDSIDGIVLLVDEADKAPAAAGLGLVCKLLTEAVSRSGKDFLCIGLAGLPEITSLLRQSHESSLRIFRMLDLKPLEYNEVMQVLDAGLKEAAEKNGFETKITPDAKVFIAGLSEGYPHFLQEFAYCAFEEDSDNTIDLEDVSSSLYKENGAFDQLGHRYFNQYYAEISSADYQKVLSAMAEHLDQWVNRSDIIKETRLKAGTVDNALRALRAKRLIFLNENQAGFYRLPFKSFAIWIKLKTKARELARSINEPGLFSD